jgi:hypothetical protein
LPEMFAGPLGAVLSLPPQAATVATNSAITAIGMLRRMIAPNEMSCYRDFFSESAKT